MSGPSIRLVFKQVSLYVFGPRYTYVSTYVCAHVQYVCMCVHMHCMNVHMYVCAHIHMNACCACGYKILEIQKIVVRQVLVRVLQS